VVAERPQAHQSGSCRTVRASVLFTVILGCSFVAHMRTDAAKEVDTKTTSRNERVLQLSAYVWFLALQFCLQGTYLMEVLTVA